MKYIPIILMLILLGAWFGLQPTTAQPQPEPSLPTAEVVCSPYFMPADTPVRSCANIGCSPVQTVSAGQSVCVIGTADDPNWLWIDLDPLDPQNPPLFVPKDVISPNAADSAPRFSRCQPMLVNGDQTSIYSCADKSCRVLSFLLTDEWVCAREYLGGQYEGWAFAEMSDRDTPGWIELSSLRPSQGYRQDAPVYVAPAVNSPNNTVIGYTGDTEPVNLENSTEPLKLSVPRAPCQQYQVVVLRTNLRECASVNCAIKETLENGTGVCVRGITPNKGWLIVDREPEVADSELYAVYENAVSPSIDFEEVSLGENRCFDRLKINSQVTALVRSCPSLTCGSVDRLEYGEEVCAVSYGGTFNEWIQVTGTDVVRNGWIHGSLVTSAVEQVADPNDPNLPPVEPTLVAQIPPTPLATPAPTIIPVESQSQEATFIQLQIPDVELSSARLNYRFPFTVPPTWSLNDGVYLNLNLDYFNILPADASGIPPSVLAVRLDDVLISSIELDDSNPTGEDVEIRIPEALLARSLDGAHNIGLELISQDSCEAGGSTFVMVRSALSYFHFEYDLTSPILDWALYPQPLFIPNLNPAPQPIFIVLPDTPTLEDIQSGGLVALGIGGATRNQIKINLRTPRTLTDEEKANNTLILVGSPESHSLIRQFYEETDRLPTSLNSTGEITYAGTPVAPQQGVLQLSLNPENPLFAVAMVTGTTPEGIRYAAHAMTGTPSGFSGTLAIVNGYREPIPATRFASEVSFQEIGYNNILLTSALEQYIEFEVPYTVGVTENAQVVLNFQISPALQEQNSDFSVWLNDEYPVSSNNLQNLTPSAGGTYMLEIPIPADLLRRGFRNTLRFSVTGATEVGNPCISTNVSSNVEWININQQSRLLLPNEPFIFTPRTVTIADFPEPLTSQRDLADLIISLPDNPTQAELEQIYQLLGVLAANTDDGGSFFPKFAFGEFPPETDLAQYDILVVGRPSTNSLLAQLNPILPQPFDEGTDNPAQRYAKMPSIPDLGILQFMPSFWSSNHAIFVVTGSSEAGLTAAMNVILSPDADPALFAGDITFVNGISPLTLRSYEN